jgi:hypothetical protein
MREGSIWNEKSNCPSTTDIDLGERGIPQTKQKPLTREVVRIGPVEPVIAANGTTGFGVLYRRIAARWDNTKAIPVTSLLWWPPDRRQPRERRRPQSAP